MILSALLIAASVCGGTPPPKVLTVTPVVAHSDTCSCCKSLNAKKPAVAPKSPAVAPKPRKPRKPAVVANPAPPVVVEKPCPDLIKDCRNEWIEGFTKGQAAAESRLSVRNHKEDNVILPIGQPVAVEKKGMATWKKVGLGVLAGVAIGFVLDDDERRYVYAGTPGPAGPKGDPGKDGYCPPKPDKKPKKDKGGK